MKMFIIAVLALISMSAFADRGPFFEAAHKAPITSGELIFNSLELSSLGNGQYIGDVLIKKTTGGFEVGAMIYSCSYAGDDSLGCKYLRYDSKKAKHFNECEVFYNEFFNCY